ncbi:MAG: hypothetical protein QOE90_447 [Thermoplasmata archaeon]|jgi:hypothetical protein|nr:hypothetical protein [Thermoplasmata archaeon]
MAAHSYTLDDAIEEAYAALEGRFGQVDQVAAVQLATFLYGVKARDEFQTRKQDDADQLPYGGGLTH